MLSFFNKATSWMFVASGGFLFAIKETYELVEHLEWNIAWFWAVIVALGGLSVINTAYRIVKSERIAKKYSKTSL